MAIAGAGLVLGVSLGPRWVSSAVAAPEGADVPVAPPPGPAAPPAAEEDLFQKLLAAQGDGEWRGILKRILKEKDGVWLGQVLGGLFRDRALYADKAALVAYTAAYLCDDHDHAKVLLGEDIVRRAFRDPTFLAALRRHLTAGEGGWSRLLDIARGMLSSTDPRARAVAAWFLSCEDGDLREALRKDLVGQAKADLPFLATADPNASELASAYLDAFQQLFAYRFASVEEAVTTLESLAGLDLASVNAELSRRKDAPTSQMGRKLLEYGKRLVDAAVQSGNLDDFEEFLDPARTQMRELRRYAVQKVAALSPRADPAWTRILALILRGEDDAQTLKRALDILDGVAFAEVPDEARKLSSAIARRLLERGPDGLRERDAIDDRVKMAKDLGVLRQRTPEIDQILAQSGSMSQPVLVEVVRSLGSLAGANAKELGSIYAEAKGGDDRAQAVRAAVMDALGRPGLRTSPDETVAAAALLREVLTGEGAEGVGRAASTTVRKAALRSLGSYPGAQTAEVLRRYALGDDADEAKVAIVVLGKAAFQDDAAVGALADIARSDTTPVDRRTQALQSLAALGHGAPAGRLSVAHDVVTALLASKTAQPEVRFEAAKTAASLGDAAALGDVADFWLEDPSRPVGTGALADLIEDAARADDTHDDQIAEVLLDKVLKKAPWSGVDELSARLVQQHARNGLRLARAKLLFERATTADLSSAEAQASLEPADQLLVAVLGADPKDDATGALPLRVKVQIALGSLAPDDATRKGHLLLAVQLAAKSGQAETAKLGRGAADTLAQPPLLALLTPEEKSRLDQDHAAIDRVLKGS